MVFCVYISFFHYFEYPFQLFFYIHLLFNIVAGSPLIAFKLNRTPAINPAKYFISHSRMQGGFWFHSVYVPYTRLKVVIPEHNLKQFARLNSYQITQNTPQFI